MLSLTTYLTKSIVRNIPITGYTRYNQLAFSSSNESVKNATIWFIIPCRTNAATAAKKPTRKARTRTKVLSLTCLTLHSRKRLNKFLYSMFKFAITF